MSNSFTPETNNSEGVHSIESSKESSTDPYDYDQIISYQPFLAELEELNQEFLLRNYATVWSGCLELIVKLIRLPSPICSPTSEGIMNGQTALPMVEAWKLHYSPEAQDKSKQIPEHFLISFQLWMNTWSLLITLIGKWHEQTQGFNCVSPISSQEKPKGTFKAPITRFSIKDIEMVEDKIYAMDRSIESIWWCLSQFYYPEPHTIPSDLVLGLMLIAVKQEKFQTAEEIYTAWQKSIPESWKVGLKNIAPNINWDDDSEDSWAVKFCLNYDSIMTLYLSHVLVGQRRWNDAPSLLKDDLILPEERKFLIKELLDQAWQEHEVSLHRKQALPVHSASALAALQGSYKEKSNVGSQSSTPDVHGTLMSKENSSADEEQGFLFKYLQYFKESIHRKSSLAAVTGMFAVVVILVWVSQRKKLKDNPSTGIFTGGWGAYWLYRIFKSVRPALPPTSGGPDSL